MNEKTVLLVFIILLVPHTITVNGLTPGDYHEKFWGGGLNVWVHYPDEAEPGGSITVNIYIVSGKFPRGNQVEEVKAKISVLTTSSSAVLHDSTLISNTYMQSGEEYNQSIQVSLPSDARWFMTIQMDTVSYQQDMTNRQEAHVTLDATQIRVSTYSDLQAQIEELKAYNTQLGQQISQLQNQVDAIQDLGDDPDLLSEYIELQDTFNELLELHSANVEYIENFEAQMADTVNKKDTRIGELDEQVAALTEEYQRLESELESTLSELEEYLATESTNSEPEVEVVTDYGSRNLFIGTTLLASAIAIALYIRNNRTMLT